MITLAPEVCNKDCIELMRRFHVIVSAGHSNATYNQSLESFSDGVTTVTHLYNAMSGLQHREPGLVGAVFNDDEVMSSIIPDGYHTDFAAISIAKKIMGDRLFVITDAVTECNEGLYQHQLQNNKYVFEDTLSGSALTMHKAFLNLINYAHIDIDEAINMCSSYPAKALKADNMYGKIAPQYAAQFAVLDTHLQLEEMIIV